MFIGVGATTRPMSMKRWDHPAGTCRALIAVYGRQVVLCHHCKRATNMPALHVPFDPCPFTCRYCGARGEIKDATETPEDYLHEVWRPRRDQAG